MSYISVDIDIDDHIDEFLNTLTDSDLIEECKERDIEVSKSKDEPFKIVDPKETIKKIICNKVGLNYLTDDATILMELTRIYS